MSKPELMGSTMGFAMDTPASRMRHAARNTRSSECRPCTRKARDTVTAQSISSHSSVDSALFSAPPAPFLALALRDIFADDSGKAGRCSQGVSNNRSGSDRGGARFVLIRSGCVAAARPDGRIRRCAMQAALPGRAGRGFCAPPSQRHGFFFALLCSARRAAGRLGGPGCAG